MTPRSSCPGGGRSPPRADNRRLIYEIDNVTEIAVGISRTSPWLGPSGPHLQPAWVIFGKHRRVNSGACRSPCSVRRTRLLMKAAVILTAAFVKVTRPIEV